MGDVIYEFAKTGYQKISDVLSSSAAFGGILNKIEEITGIPGSFIVTGLTVLFFLCFLLGSGPFLLLYSAVVLYPAYQSFKCLEEDNKEKALFWIKYWIVFSGFHAAEHFGDRVIYWLPGYQILKFVFLVWCFAPVSNNGSVILYDNYIRPLFLRNADTLDRVTDMVPQIPVM